MPVLPVAGDGKPVGLVSDLLDQVQRRRVFRQVHGALLAGGQRPQAHGVIRAAWIDGVEQSYRAFHLRHVGGEFPAFGGDNEMFTHAKFLCRARRSLPQYAPEAFSFADHLD